EGWINGGFFVLEPAVLDYIEGDDTPWEYAPLERLAADGQLVAYRHEDFWQCMDTLRDLRLLESLWAEGRAPWKIWSDYCSPIVSLGIGSVATASHGDRYVGDSGGRAARCAAVRRAIAAGGRVGGISGRRERGCRQ